MDEQRQDVQLEPTYSSSVPIRDVALCTCWKQWTIGRCGERGSEISTLIARHDDNDEKKLVAQLIEQHKGNLQGKRNDRSTFTSSSFIFHLW